MALIVVDASVLIAVLDPTDSLNGAAVRALTALVADDLVVPASALAETLVSPARAGRLRETRQKVASLVTAVTAIDEPVAVEAAELRASHASLRLPDALVLATGEVLRAHAVLTGDSRWRSISKRVHVLA